MTSVWARNYESPKLDREYYQLVTKEGHPLQKQVPQTYQLYDGVGGESLALDGSNRVVIDSDLASGPLVLNALDNYNLHGRVIHVLLMRTTASALTFNYPNGEIHVPGTEVTSQSLLFPAGQVPTTFVLDFYSLADVLVTESNTVPGPPMHLPAALNYVVQQDAGNIYDDINGLRIAFDPAYADSTNTTTVVYNTTDDWFEINTDGNYYVSTNHSLRGNLDRCVRISIGVSYQGAAMVGRTWGVTAAGLVNQNLSLTWAGFLQAGDRVSVFSVFEPLGPAPIGGYGLMTGVNTQNTTARNFIQILQL